MIYVNLVQISLIVFKIREVEIGKILVHVNNTLVLRATFFTTRHTTMCLNSTGIVNVYFANMVVSTMSDRRHQTQ